MSSPRPMSDSTPASNLASLWARKYVEDLLDYAWGNSDDPQQAADPAQVGKKLLDTLRFASAQGWSQTEKILSGAIHQHRLDPALIDPWQIAESCSRLFTKAVESYQQHLTAEQFSVVVAADCGQIRQKYTERDPRVLGFFSMQFHYTGQILMQKLSYAENRLLGSYFKVMDDQIYMPLQRAYSAAAQHPYDSPELLAVRQLLPQVSVIAEAICAEVWEAYPHYEAYTGKLNSLQVRISSIRDVEMFQIYLCLCLLEDNMNAVQNELFPLCIMLYPALKVKWELVRHLLSSLDRELKVHLGGLDYRSFEPFLNNFQQMFSADILPDEDPVWNHSPDTIQFVDMARSLMSELQK